jgi:hypothetical protein
MATERPLVPSLAPLPASRSLSNPEWVGHELVGTIEGDDERMLCRWTDLRQSPRTLWRFRAFPAELKPSPDGRILALTLFHWGDDGSCSGKDGSVLLVPLEPSGGRGEVLPLAGSSEGFALGLNGLTWSPTGHLLAIRGVDHRRAPPHNEVIRLYDVASRELIAVHWQPSDQGRTSSRGSIPSSGPELPAWAVRASFPYRGLAYGAGRSPDGRFQIQLEGETLVVTDRQGLRRELALDGDREREALKGLELHVDWVGGSSLHLNGDEHYVVDLETLKLRYYLPSLPLGASWWSESPDQRLVLIQHRHGPVRSGTIEYLWGEVVWDHSAKRTTTW